MERCFSFFCLFSITTICVGQNVSDTALELSNKNVYTRFNPDQIDFGKDYYEIVAKNFSESSIKDSLLAHCDFSAVWLSGQYEQNGVIGKDYWRIRLHIDDVKKDGVRPNVYHVWGKTKVKDNICSFKGDIQILKIAFQDSLPIYIDPLYKAKGIGNLLASYLFYEDSTQNHSGIFKGFMTCDYFLDSTGTRMKLDMSLDMADGYSNSNYVGTWTDYRAGIMKKCIWGDNRLLFTFDFAEGDGEWRVAEKYKKNGWETFDDGSEYYNASKNDESERWELKDKWWLSK